MPRRARRCWFNLMGLVVIGLGGALSHSARADEALESLGKPPEPALDESERPPAEVVLRDFLVLPPPGKYARAPLPQDPIDAAIAQNTWRPPTAETALTDVSGALHRWQKAQADKDDWLTDAALAGGGYASAKIEMPFAATMLLEAQGHATVYVNGVPRVGDPYQTGWLKLPVPLKAGQNELLFHVAAGRLKARLVRPAADVAVSLDDATLPDALVGHEQPFWGAVLLTNSTDRPLGKLELVATREGGEPLRTPVSGVTPHTARKIAFQIPGGNVSADVKKLPVKLRLEKLLGEQRVVLNEMSIELPVRLPAERHVRTFVSEIDGSVQYYAVVPATDSSEDASPGLILTLHGAGVQATGQAEQYATKSWAHVVAPTNRRPFGFDWEDWGRRDALEVLADAQAHLDVDPRRVYVTGHSMGGHGAWHLAAAYPDRFAAVGPSAGWCSMWTYGMLKRPKNSSPLEELLLRGSSASETLMLKHNLAGLGVYILHGQADENVPVSEARLMRGQLALFHDNFAYYERPKAGHWWGPACCDWPLMMEFFHHQQAPSPDEVTRVDFTTAHPGVSAKSHWLTIEAQEKQFRPSRAQIELDREGRHFQGKTENISRFALDVRRLEPNRPLKITLDGQTIETVAWPADTRRVWLSRRDETWHVRGRPAAEAKGPARYGTFKDAINNRVVFVYGTRGTNAENAWALAKARYDAETFWYRGNGSIDVVADTDFAPDRFAHRNVVLYGNADTNAAWSGLLATSPVQVRRGVVRIEGRPEQGDDLACLFIRPRADSPTASVAAVSGTGLKGFKATDRLRYFVSGVAYPDLLLYSAKTLQEGIPQVRAAGFFGIDWSIETGEFAWRDLAL